MFGFAAGFLVLAVGIVVVAVVVSRNNRYPDYNTLNYQLQDTCMSLLVGCLGVGWLSDSLFADEGKTFFDMFNYFTGYDPSSGFVQYVSLGMALVSLE